jgi:signal transduction histidine kinase
MEKWFQNNMDVVYLFYGLCFISMGILILASPKKKSGFKLAGIIWLLAVFALIHGFGEWLDMFSFINSDNKLLGIISLIALIISYCFLFEFARRILLISDNIFINALSSNFRWWLMPIAFSFIFFILIDTSDKFLSMAQILIRYLLGFPSYILTSAGFYLYYRQEKDALKHLKVDKYFLIAYNSFWIYGILAGVLVPKGEFFPSNLLNSDNFHSMIGIPVQIFRIAVGMSITVTIVGSIRLFNKEMEDKLILYNEQLEGIVVDRTQRLININDKLKEEIQIHKETENKLHMLTSKILSIKEDERAIISREIHDELGQIITGMKIDISLLTEDMLALKCDDIFTEKLISLSFTTDRILKQVQNIAMFLRPVEIDNLGVISAIKTYIDDFPKRNGISCSLRYLLYCNEEELKFDDETEISIFRIVQEALTNIIRHSSADEACVIVEYVNGYLRFLIIDNGKGISDFEISKNSSLGILGMKERAMMIGGEINIISAKNNGTMVTLSIPWRNNN